MKLQSDFAMLDVKRGRVNLRKACDEGDRIKVTITGYIDADQQSRGNDDGVSQEFTVIVDSVSAETSN